MSSTTTNMSSVKTISAKGAANQSEETVPLMAANSN